MNRIVVSNDMLFTCKSSLGDTLSLHKQSYSDGTCFYMLKDDSGNMKAEHGNSSLLKLIRQLKHEIKVAGPCKNRNDKINIIHKEVVRWKENIIRSMEGII